MNTWDMPSLPFEYSTSQKSCSALYKRRDVKRSDKFSLDSFTANHKNPSSSRQKKLIGALNNAVGTKWCSCVEHCATSLKVAGSIADGVFPAAL